MSLSFAKKVLLIFMLSLCLPASSWAGDATTERQAAAKRYLATVDLNQMLSNTAHQVSRQIPEQARQPFIKAMEESDTTALKASMQNALVSVFTTKELNALADFYGSGPGKSAMEKLPKYMAQITPIIQSHTVEVLKNLKKP